MNFNEPLNYDGLAEHIRRRIERVEKDAISEINNLSNAAKHQPGGTLTPSQSRFGISLQRSLDNFRPSSDTFGNVQSEAWGKILLEIKQGRVNNNKAVLHFLKALDACEFELSPELSPRQALEGVPRIYRYPFPDNVNWTVTKDGLGYSRGGVAIPYHSVHSTHDPETNLTISVGETHWYQADCACLGGCWFIICREQGCGKCWRITPNYKIQVERYVLAHFQAKGGLCGPKDVTCNGTLNWGLEKLLKTPGDVFNFPFSQERGAYQTLSEYFCPDVDCGVFGNISQLCSHLQTQGRRLGITMNKDHQLRFTSTH
ncbi:hypothetical protein T439DRAFT_337442 [Meredithblackwellia eburnea MCA 4105]